MRSRFAPVVSAPVDPSGITVSAADVAEFLEGYEWQCAVCCERQPPGTTDPEFVAFATAILQRKAYIAQCRLAGQRPGKAFPMPTIPPAIDLAFLHRNVCRDCGSSGVKCLPGASGSVHGALLRQLLALTCGSSEEAAAYMAAHGLTDDTIAAVLHEEAGDGPAWAVDAAAVDPWPADGNFVRPRWGAAVPPFAATASDGAAATATASTAATQALKPAVYAVYDDRMLLHDMPSAYFDDLSCEARASVLEDAAAEVSMGALPRPRPQDAIPPERPDRLRAAAGYLVCTGLLQQCSRVAAREATPEETDLTVAGDLQSYLMQQYSAVEAAAAAAAEADAGSSARHSHRGAVVVTDTYYCAHTATAAAVALGSTCALVDKLLTSSSSSSSSGREWPRGVALVRPPGHHADAHNSRGFCIHNNAGGAARKAVEVHGLQRVLIVDWDVHHGDGTEAMFYEDPRVLYFSLHRHDSGAFYPGTGSASRVGQGRGAGYNINVPLDGEWYSDSEALTVLRHLLFPVVAAWQPQLVLVSSGFDAARGDPLGDWDITPAAYSAMLHELMHAAAPGTPTAVIMEGGYNLRSVAVSMEALVRVLLGEPPLPADAFASQGSSIIVGREGEGEEAVPPGGVGNATKPPRRAVWRAVARAAELLGPYWPCLAPAAAAAAEALGGAEGAAEAAAAASSSSAAAAAATAPEALPSEAAAAAAASTPAAASPAAAPAFAAPQDSS